MITTHIFIHTPSECLYFKKSFKTLRRVHCLIGQVILNLTSWMDSHLILLFSYFKALKLISRALLFSPSLLLICPFFSSSLSLLKWMSTAFLLHCFLISLMSLLSFICVPPILLRGLPGYAPDLCNSAGSFLIYCTGVQRHFAGRFSLIK